MPGHVLEVALAAARAAAEVHRAHVGRVAEAEWGLKGDVDFVTHVDREAEREIVARIGDAFPGHRVLAEEGTTADAAEDAEWLWIVDPLDGTTNFLHGYPMFCASIGVMHRGELVAGAVVDTNSRDEWTALRGEGAYRNGERIHVSRIEDLRRALIGTGFPFRAIDTFPQYLSELDTIVRATSGPRRAGSAALDLCHLAAGWFDGFWEHLLSPWDIAAGVLIVREAGGVVTRQDGSELDVLVAGSVLGGNPAVYGQLLGLLNG